MPLENFNKFERRYDIDWLRVIAMIIIFFYHCARAFDHLPWHVKNNELNVGFTIFIVLNSAFIMPLFFILSGMSIYHALGVRTQKEFLVERSKRLLIPLIFCIFTILSLHVYYEALYGSGNVPSFSGSYIEFLLFYYYISGNYLPIIYGIYLWYLLILFIFSLITIKLFIYLRKEKNQVKIVKFANFLNKPGRIFLLVIPIMILELIGVLFIPGLDFGGWNILPYLCFFIYGYLLASNPHFKETIERNGLYAFIVMIITSIIILTGFFLLAHDSLIFNIIFIIFWPLNCLCWLITILSFASKKLNFNNKALKSFNEIVLPFYILHQTIIIIVVFYIIKLDTVVIIKYLLVVSLAFGITIGLVLIIKKVNLLRFLFGMRLLKKNN